MRQMAERVHLSESEEEAARVEEQELANISLLYCVSIGTPGR
jgi:hypothetical protein